MRYTWPWKNTSGVDSWRSLAYQPGRRAGCDQQGYRSWRHRRGANTDPGIDEAVGKGSSEDKGGARDPQGLRCDFKHPLRVYFDCGEAPRGWVKGPKSWSPGTSGVLALPFTRQYDSASLSCLLPKDRDDNTYLQVLQWGLNYNCSVSCVSPSTQ